MISGMLVDKLFLLISDLTGFLDIKKDPKGFWETVFLVVIFRLMSDRFSSCPFFTLAHLASVIAFKTIVPRHIDHPLPQYGETQCQFYYFKHTVITHGDMVPFFPKTRGFCS